MARETGTLKSVDKVLEWYDDNSGNFFSIWKGTGVQLQHRYSKMESAEENRKQLQNILDMLRDSGDPVGYTIKLHPKAEKQGYFDKESGCKETESFILCEPQPYTGVQSSQMVNPADFYALKYELEGLKAREAEKDAKIAALEMELNAEEEEEEEQPGGLSGVIAGLLSRPDIQNALISNFVGAFAPARPAKVMAGSMADSKIKDEALDILAANGVSDEDLMLLANLAINNPGQFSWLLKMLRNQ